MSAGVDPFKDVPEECRDRLEAHLKSQGVTPVIKEIHVFLTADLKHDEQMVEHISGLLGECVDECLDSPPSKRMATATARKGAAWKRTAAPARVTAVVAGCT